MGTEDAFDGDVTGRWNCRGASKLSHCAMKFPRRAIKVSARYKMMDMKKITNNWLDVMGLALSAFF